MKKKTLKALKSSIKHWEKNSVATQYDVNMGPSGCALCGEFFNVGCEGCPVAKATGKILCDGSPYVAASKALHRGDMCSFHKKAKKEVKFLKALLPKKPKKPFVACPTCKTMVHKDKIKPKEPRRSPVGKGFNDDPYWKAGMKVKCVNFRRSMEAHWTLGKIYSLIEHQYAGGEPKIMVHANLVALNGDSADLVEVFD